MANTLTNCTITSEIFDEKAEELTLVVTANNGYTFLGQSISYRKVYNEDNIYNKIELVVSADGKSVSCNKGYMFSPYIIKCVAVEEPTPKYTHDLTNVLGSEYVEASYNDRTVIENAFTTQFDSGTSLGSMISEWWIGMIDPNTSDYKLRMNEPCSISFTDSTGVTRVIDLKPYSFDLPKRFYVELTTTESNYKVASNIVWTIPTYYVEPVTPTYTITQSLTDCTSDCSLTEITENTALTINVIPNDGFEFVDAPTCEMGNVSIVASQLESGYQFVIDAVTSNIVLVAKATSTTPTEVNNADYGFINIYNPTSYELQEASSKWFYDMSAGSYIDLSKYISALFITYGKPLVLTEKDTIKFSSYDTKVLTHVVREPKIEIDCGTITVEELHHNALDYSPNSSVRIFLPFIGYENIDIDLIMGSELSLKYVVDVLSGKCIAKLQCNKSEQVFDIYTFVGDCSLQIPYFMNDSETSNNSIVTRAYNLDDRTPFLLIERATAYMPTSSRLDGVSSNELAILGDLTGYTKCKEVQIYGIECTSSEKNEIETLLKKGVIL